VGVGTSPTWRKVKGQTTGSSSLASLVLDRLALTDPTVFPQHSQYTQNWETPARLGGVQASIAL